MNFRSALLAAVTLATACKRHPPPHVDRSLALAEESQPPATAPAARFEQQAPFGMRLVLDGHPDWACSLSYGVHGEVSCSAVGPVSWPTGTKLAIGAVEAPLESNGGTAKLEKAYAIYGTLPIVKEAGSDNVEILAAQEIAPRGTLRVRFSNGVETSAPLPREKASAGLTDTVMKYVAEHPLAFEGEGAHQGPHTIYYVHPTQSSAVLGAGKTLAEVDWVASGTSTIEKVDGVTCHFNTGSAYPLETETQTVKVTDRKTGDVVETKTFAPKSKACPTIAYAGRAILGPGRDPIFEWLRALAKKHP